MNISGQYILDPDGPGGIRAVKLINENIDHLRMLAIISVIRSNGSPVPAMSVYEGLIRRFGLAVDPSDCSYLSIEGGHDAIELASSDKERLHKRPPSYLISCKLIRANAKMTQQYLDARQSADIVFNRVEDACPNLFTPRRTTTLGSDLIWHRNYINEDLQMWISHGYVKFRNVMEGEEPTVIGLEKDWLKEPQKMNCSIKRASRA